MEEKKKLRTEMHIKRANVNSNKKLTYDLEICNKLEALIDKINAKVVHAYLPMGKEIDITPLLEKLLAKNITVVSPKTLKNRKLQNLVLNTLNEIEQGVFGTKHPSNSVEYIGNYDLIIVPGLAFDDFNYRLGYGAGYYDNFLVNHPNSQKIGIFYPFQKVEKVPTEPHDVKLDEILFLDL